MFHVNYRVRRSVAEASLNDQIHFTPLTFRDVGEDFLVQELD